jgi:uncharacterized protein YbaR (Trm112 family)
VTAAANSKVDPKLLEILVCPVTRGPLEYDAEAGELISRQAGLAFPIRDGIPIMLVDEARPLDQPRAAPAPK